MTLRECKGLAVREHIYQRGPNDYAGHARDNAWRTAAGKARTWHALFAALPMQHRLSDVAANRGAR